MHRGGFMDRPLGLSSGCLQHAGMNPDPSPDTPRTRLEIGHCELFRFQCPQSWETMQRTDDPDIRFCEKCREHVHFCHSEEELRRHGGLGRCAAIEIQVPERPGRFILGGRPDVSYRCGLCHGRIDENTARDSPQIIWLDFQELAGRFIPSEPAGDPPDGLSEAFRRLTGGALHAACLGKWKYRNAFIAFWNRELAKTYENKFLVVTPMGEVVYGEAGPWRLTPAEADRQAQAAQTRERERAAYQEALRRKELDLQQGMDGARRKAIAMGLATAENVDSILRHLPASDFRRDFGEFRVSRAFFSDSTT